jgi:hypothetical protein
MNVTNPHAFRVIVCVDNQLLRSFTVMPDGNKMVAVSPRALRTGQGPLETFGYIDYDVLIGGVRYRITEREGRDFIVVPWEEGMDG